MQASARREAGLRLLLRLWDFLHPVEKPVLKLGTNVVSNSLLGQSPCKSQVRTVTLHKKGVT